MMSCSRATNEVRATHLLIPSPSAAHSSSARQAASAHVVHAVFASLLCLRSSSSSSRVLFGRRWRVDLFTMPLTRSELRSAFRLHGFSLRPDASRHLESLLAPLDDRAEAEEWVAKIANALQAKSLNNATVSKELVASIVQVS